MLTANQSKFLNDDAYLKEINEQRRALEREKIKFRDERRSWSKQNYTDARFDEVMDLLKDTLPLIRNSEFQVGEVPHIDGETDLLCCISDLHIGAMFSSYWGEYNSFIAKERLNQYLEEIIKIASTHKSKNIHLCCLGDLVNGAIHKTIQITNKENVVDQVKLAIEYISSFCYELTKHFENVFFYNIGGNHSRLTPNKDDAIKDERLDDLIGWTVSELLKDIPNFRNMNHRKLDSTIGEANIRGKNYLLLHGDMDSITKSGIGNLVTAIGFCPEYIVTGHKHAPAMYEFNGITVYQSGSVCGSGDDYTVQNRLSGKPSQTVLVCDNSGVKCCYNVKLV